MDEPSSILAAGQFVVVAALILVNGFFVAAEFAFVAIRRSRVEQLLAEKHPRAADVHRAVKHLDASIAATQLGVTMASLGLGWIGEPVLAGVIEPVFRFLPSSVGEAGAHTIAAIIAFVLITLVVIVFGELVPKRLAIRHPEGTALAVSRPFRLFLATSAPVVALVNSLGNLVYRLITPGHRVSDSTVHTIEEIKLLVAESREAGLLGEEAEEIVGRAFEFDDLAARQMMVPRVEIVALPVGASVQTALSVAAAHHHTRLPVYEGDVDHIVGIVHLVDVVAACQAPGAAIPVRNVMRPALLLPETIRTDALLTKMRLQRAQMAILVDEYGGTAGLVTIHDLVERLVGPVLDAHEVAQDAIELVPDGALLGGLALIHDVNDRFGLEIPDDEYDTVGGFVFARVGRVPQPGDSVVVDHHTFRVEAMDGKRVALVRLVREHGKGEAGRS